MPERDLGPALAAAVERLDALIAAYEAEPDPATRERAFELLQAVDAVHRPGLARLAALLDQLDPAARGQVLDDPAVRLLLEMYELLPPEPAPPPGGFVALEEVAVVTAPRRAWVRVAGLADLPPDGVLSVLLDEARVLLARVGQRVYAYQDGDSANPLPVGLGRREGDAVICPWHGCRYDLASGQRLDQPGTGLPTLPVRIVDGQVEVELPGRAQVSRLGAEWSA